MTVTATNFFTTINIGTVNAFETQVLKNLKHLLNVDISASFIDSVPLNLNPVIADMTNAWKLYLEYLAIHLILRQRQRQPDVFRILEAQSMTIKIEKDYHATLQRISGFRCNDSMKQVLQECRKMYQIPLNVQETLINGTLPVFQLPKFKVLCK